MTRIRTQKNEIVTIPNGTVLGGMVMNFSAEARKNGVIFYTSCFHRIQCALEESARVAYRRGSLHQGRFGNSPSVCSAVES